MDVLLTLSSNRKDLIDVGSKHTVGVQNNNLQITEQSTGMDFGMDYYNNRTAAQLRILCTYITSAFLVQLQILCAAAAACYDVMFCNCNSYVFVLIMNDLSSIYFEHHLIIIFTIPQSN